MMLVYSDARYKYTPETKEQMRSDLALFCLEHLRESCDSMTKLETFCGNERREVFRCDDGAEFTIITRSYYGRTDVFWTHSGTDKMYGYTEYAE